MFGRKKSEAFSEQVETLIGHTTTLKGSLTSSGALRIDGQFEGDIATTADLIIGEAGQVQHSGLLYALRHLLYL